MKNKTIFKNFHRPLLNQLLVWLRFVCVGVVVLTIITVEANANYEYPYWFIPLLVLTVLLFLQLITFKTRGFVVECEFDESFSHTFNGDKLVKIGGTSFFPWPRTMAYRIGARWLPKTKEVEILLFIEHLGKSWQPGVDNGAPYDFPMLAKVPVNTPCTVKVDFDSVYKRVKETKMLNLWYKRLPIGIKMGFYSNSTSGKVKVFSKIKRY